MADPEIEPGCEHVLQTGQKKDCCQEGGHDHAYKPYPTSPYPPNPFPTTQAPPGPPQLDYSKFGIVQAAQYGALERCQHLIEVEGVDVTEPDQENVTLLHWAAINNRIKMVEYFLSKGAEVDRKGGNLDASPLHWAVRQGHLPMVICLMKHGADPRSRDIEGCSAIHVAAQFSQTGILGYMIAKDVGVDVPDQNNMTPLMWSAYRSFGVDTTRLLIALNASVNKADKVKRNTALHWAVMSNNHNVLKVLLEAGASLDALNEEGLTARDIAVQKNNMWVIKLFDKELQERGQGKPNFLKSLTTDKVTRRKVQFALPMFLMFAIGAVLEFSSSWMGIIISAAVLYALSFLIVRWFWDNRAATSPMPLAVYLATKFYMYTTWILWFWPYVNSWSVLLPFLFTSIFLAYNFTKAWTTDPGFIKTSVAQQKQTIVELSEKGMMDIGRFCSTCLIRKPIRSKHCSVCGKCVAKMDHHCPWIDNCVGAGNHHYFIGYLTFLFVMINYYCYGAITYFDEVCGPHDQGVWTSIINSCSCSPWVAWGLVNGAFHFLWVGALFVCQVYQVFWVGMTTNERMNAFRYTHFADHSSGTGKSPFSHGILKNIANFFNFSFCGLIKPDPMDWYTQYELRSKYTV